LVRSCYFVSDTTDEVFTHTRLTAVSFLLHKRLTATHTFYICRRHRTHAHTGLRFACETSAFNPSRTVLPPRPPRSSGQLLSARGPSELSVSVTDGQENVLFLHVFSVRGVVLLYDTFHVVPLGI